MNVSSQQLLHELALKANCNYNPEKEEIIKELSTENSMQCLKHNVTEKDLEKTVINGQAPLEQQVLNKIVSSPKVRRNFIPYPDHNYGQQPPLTPPAEDGKLISIKTESIVDRNYKNATSTEEEQEGVTKCICEFEHDDGFMICCDDCSSWQHVECMGFKSSKVPEKYSCHKCNPRELDIERARAIQTKKKETMSEGDDEGEEDDTGSEDEAGKTMYTAISNTPTRITLLSNGNNPTVPGGVMKGRSKKGTRVQKRKLSDQRNTRRKTRRREKNDGGANAEEPFSDSNSLNNFFGAHKLYEEIEENKYDTEFQNMHFKLFEAIPSIDFKNVVKCCTVSDVTSNRKGLIAYCDISAGNFILEYRGTLMSHQRFEELHPMFKESCPYVVMYNKIKTLQLVIDARNYGNDARFVRRSCTPNAELQHLTANGALHVMMISQGDIKKDSEITIPFDFPLDSYRGFLECACNTELCSVRLHNIEWKKTNSIDRNESIQQQTVVTVVTNTLVKNELQELQIESESDSNVIGDESKHEKLSREERKLQALVRQFEKLEKKQDTTKKPKTPILKTSSVDENTIPVMGMKNSVVVKKSNKRKMSMSGRRRTRQSSCSSEPVSPAENEGGSAMSTPTTPLSNSHPQTLFENAQLLRQKGRKEKEPLTLTLPIQRKFRQDCGTVSPTPPCTPIGLLSPARSLGEPSTFSLSLDTHALTQLESTPLKAGLSNGLLQIANVPTTPFSTSFSSTLGNVTAEERIGDLTLRLGDSQPSSPASRFPFHGNGPSQRKYYGSLKKHWLRKHCPATTSMPAGNLRNGISINGEKQISLAALVASISQEQHVKNMISVLNPTPVFKRPQSCVPLKKRHLLRAAQRKACQSSKSTNHTVPTDITEDNKLHTTNRHHVMVNGNDADVKTEWKNNLLAIQNEAKGQSNSLELVVDTISTRTHSCPTEDEEKPTVPDITTHDENVFPVTENINSVNKLREEEKNNDVTMIESDVTFRTPSLSSSGTLVKDDAVESKKRILETEESESTAMDEPSNKKAFLDDSFDDGSDIGLKIVVTEACVENSAETNSLSTSISISTSCTDVKNTEPVPHAALSTLQGRAEQPSPRSSIDSNPDVDSISNVLGGEHGSGSGKKKLSFKEYRNRIRSQKISNNASSSQPPLPAEEAKPQPPPDAPVSPAQRMNKAADLLLIPRTVSLLGTDVSNVTTSKSHSNDSSVNISSKLAVPSGELATSKAGKLIDPAKRQSYERTQSTSSSNSVFEPVSPGNEFDATSPREDTAFGHTIHTEITKNPFTIHNDITKHPFGKKQNQAPGLLQYLSAQKYPHLATLNSNSGGAQASSGSHYRGKQSSDYHSSDVVENDDDASSTHSNMSSTSYGSSSDVLHDRVYSNRPPYAREHNNRDYGSRESRDYYSNPPPHSPYTAPLYYQNYNQHMHPSMPRPTNSQRNNGFNNYHPPPSHGSRPRPHRGYLPFQ